jgi:hypothetical protein
VPSSLQPKVNAALHAIMNAENKEAADLVIDQFEATTAPSTRRLWTRCQGSRRPTRPLRLPGRALDPPADYQRDRVHLRHRPTAHAEDERRWQSDRQPGHGLQTAGGSPGAGAASTHPTRSHSFALGATFVDGLIIQREDHGKMPRDQTGQSTTLACAEKKPYPFRGWDSLPGRAQPATGKRVLRCAR